MKLYYFNPNGFDAQYFVMAESANEAYESLIIHLNKVNVYEVELWENVNPYEPSSFPDNYTLDVFDKGHIIQSEIS